MTDLPEYLTAPEIAGLLRMREATIREYVATGEIPGFKIGGKYRVAREDFHKWLEDQRVHCIGNAKPVSSPRAADSKTYALGKMAS